LFAGCRRVAPPPPPASPKTADPVAVADKGDLKLRLDPRANKKPGDNAPRVGENEPAMTALLADLNSKISLPFDIVVAVTNCDQPNAFYDPETHEVVVCHELIDDYYALFSRKIKDPKKLDDAVRGATSSTFFHELGHALVDAWKLPITGKEEDAVDQLSTVVLMRRTDAGERMALNGAVSFKLYANFTAGEEKIYWDEHSLDEQRFYDTICLVYGHDPEKYDYLITDGTLPEERAAMCPADYERIARSWNVLLAPYLKQPAAK
jgi:hypothetical protein